MFDLKYILCNNNIYKKIFLETLITNSLGTLYWEKPRKQAALLT